MTSPALQHTDTEAVEIARRTLRWDMMRSSLAGFIDAGWRTFALLVVTRYFDASSFAKALVPAAFMIGLLTTPIALFYFTRLRMRTSTICSINYVCAGCLFLVASAGSDKLWIFLGAGTIAAAVLAQQMPLLVHIYSTNYRISRLDYSYRRVCHAWIRGCICTNEKWTLDYDGCY